MGEYEKEGAIITDDISEADVILGEGGWRKEGGEGAKEEGVTAITAVNGVTEELAEEFGDEKRRGRREWVMEERCEEGEGGRERKADRSL